jgi:hypothetical protein
MYSTQELREYRFVYLPFLYLSFIRSPFNSICSRWYSFEGAWRRNCPLMVLFVSRFRDGTSCICYVLFQLAFVVQMVSNASKLFKCQSPTSTSHVLILYVDVKCQLLKHLLQSRSQHVRRLLALLIVGQSLSERGHGDRHSDREALLCSPHG